MSKIAVVYWNGTGNTEAMALSVAKGAQQNGAETTVFTAAGVDASMIEKFNAIAFGGPLWEQRY